jgi:hypothetical protein
LLRQTSNILYKSPPFCTNEPNLGKAQNQPNLFYAKDLRQSGRLRVTKSKPKTNPNEPKANPIFGPPAAPKAKTNPNEPNLVRLLPASLFGGFTRRLPAVRLAGLSGGPADSKAKESCCGFACDISQRLSAGQPADLRC